MAQERITDLNQPKTAKIVWSCSLLNWQYFRPQFSLCTKYCAHLGMKNFNPTPQSTVISPNLYSPLELMPLFQPVRVV